MAMAVIRPVTFPNAVEAIWLGPTDVQLVVRIELLGWAIIAAC